MKESHTVAVTSEKKSIDLEMDYNLRLTLEEERERVYTTFAELSAAYVDTHTAWIDKGYGSSDVERMDIFPAEDGDTCFVFVHGGYWRALDKSTFNFLAKGFVNNHISFVNVNYGLAPEYRIEKMISQVAQAIVSACDELKSQGLRVKNVYICGHSAGGHLGVMSSIRLRQVNSSVADCIKGVIPISALFDLSPLLNISVNETLNMTAEEATKLSPVNCIGSIYFPMLIAVGADETKGFLYQSESFFQKFQEKSKSVEISLVPETNHFSVLGAMTEDSQSFFREIISFIREHNDGEGRDEKES